MAVHPRGFIPFYERAQGICQLGPFEYGVEDWEDPEARPRFPLPRDEFVTKILQYGNRTFVDYFGELAGAQNVTTILNSTVCELVTAENPSTINEVMMRVEAGKAFRLKARAYVLAAGGIENARLLLLSSKTHTVGLGNTKDLVGRYFMERLAIRSGVIVPTDPGPVSALTSLQDSLRSRWAYSGCTTTQRKVDAKRGPS